MARFENLNVGKLTVDSLNVNLNNTNQYEIAAAGHNCGIVATTFVAACDGTIGKTDIINVTGGNTMSAVTLDFASVYFSGRSQIEGVTVANTATTDYMNYMAVRKNCLPEWKVLTAGTAAGTGATIAVTCAGVLATDLAFGTVRSLGTGNRTLAKIVLTANTITFTGSGAFTGSHSIDYVVLRRAGLVTAPTHKIFAAGRHTTVGTAAYENISVPGMRSGDVVLAVLSGGATQTFITALAITDAITVTCSADPGTTHTVDYIVFRRA